jgi:hypothetical protein
MDRPRSYLTAGSPYTSSRSPQIRLSAQTKSVLTSKEATILSMCRRSFPRSELKVPFALIGQQVNYGEWLLPAPRLIKWDLTCDA